MYVVQLIAKALTSLISLYMASQIIITMHAWYEVIIRFSYYICMHNYIIHASLSQNNILAIRLYRTLQIQFQFTLLIVYIVSTALCM